MAEEDADLAKDLAAEEETRQTAYASADAAWINAEAAAGVAATAVAAAANYNYQTGAIGAGVTYVSATAPLVTQAQQQFNAGFHQAYVTATGNDPGQSAVSSAWQQYADNMATNYESLLTQAITAWQGRCLIEECGVRRGLVTAGCERLLSVAERRDVPERL